MLLGWSRRLRRYRCGFRLPAAAAAVSCCRSTRARLVIPVARFGPAAHTPGTRRTAGAVPIAQRPCGVAVQLVQVRAATVRLLQARVVQRAVGGAAYAE
eukprot:13593112-Alexandrium_andersonii.AAC.1